MCFFTLGLSDFPISLLTVLLTKLTESLANENENDAKNLQTEAYKYCISIIMPLTFFMIFLSDEIISLLFERGEFDSNSSTQTSNALKVFLIGLPAACLIKVLTPAFYAKKIPNIPLKVNGICSIINIIITLFLFEKIGFLAIPLALSSTGWINLFLIIKEHNKNISFSLPNDSLKYAMRYIALSIGIILIIFLFDMIFLGNSKLLIESLSKIIVFGSLYIFFIYKYDSEIFNLIKPKW